MEHAAASPPRQRRTRRAGGARYAIGGGLLLIGLAIALLGGALALSAVNAANAQRFLDEWGKRGAEPGAEAFAAAEAAAIRAIRLYPGGSGAAWDRLGRIYTWAHWQRGLDPGGVPRTVPDAGALLARPLGVTGAEDWQATRARSLAAHQRAVALRPLWPYGVVRLADARLRATGGDERLNDLVKRAYRLGPWRPGVNRQITEIGLRGWRWLSGDTRDIVLENARRTVRFSPADRRRVIALAETTGKRLLIETLVLP